MIVETKNASLDTLAVTIRALHVSGKQMTLAVFRQLPSCDPFNDNGTLNTSLEHWGIVRYQLEDRPVWLVASCEGVLYRGPVADRGVRPVAAAKRDLEEMRAAVEASPAAWRAYELWRAWASVPYDQVRYAEDSNWREAPPSRSKPEFTTAELERYAKDAETRVKWETAFYDSTQAILGLPQLFIAV